MHAGRKRRVNLLVLVLDDCGMRHFEGGLLQSVLLIFILPFVDDLVVSDHDPLG